MFTYSWYDARNDVCALLGQTIRAAGKNRKAGASFVALAGNATSTRAEYRRLEPLALALSNDKPNPR